MSRDLESKEIRIRSTLLSGKPRDESLQVSILIGVVIAFVSAWAWRDPLAYSLLSASASQVVADHEYWRLLTTVAVHGDLPHLLVNAAYLVYLGYLIYGYFGFWTYPCAMLLLASLTTLLSLLSYPHPVQLIGASGLVYLMAGFWLVMYGLIERTITPGRRLLRIIGISLIVLIPTSLEPQVSYRTHAIGAAVGVAFGLGWFYAVKGRIRALEVVEEEALEIE